MKILFILILLFGCMQSSDFKALQEAFYNSDNLYVDVDLKAVHAIYGINEDDYEECLLLESLILIDQTMIYIFKFPSTTLIEKFSHDSSSYIEKFNDYFIYVNKYDESIIQLIHQYLNKS